jgi:hypothetical protein
MSMLRLLTLCAAAVALAGVPPAVPRAGRPPADLLLVNGRL